MLVGRGYARIAARIEESGTILHAPALCDIELAAGLRRGLLEARFSEFRAAEALGNYLALRVRRHLHAALLERILQLRKNLSGYDAAYVALAERLGAPFLTLDRRLARAVRRHVPTVEVVA